MTNAHNAFIDAFFFGGLVGMLFLLVLVALLASAAWRAWKFRRDPRAAALLPSVLLYPYGLPAALPLFQDISGGGSTAGCRSA